MNLIKRYKEFSVGRYLYRYNIFILGMGFDLDGKLSIRSQKSVEKLIFLLNNDIDLRDDIVEIYFVGGVKAPVSKQTEADEMKRYFYEISSEFSCLKKRCLYPTKSISESFKMIKNVMKGSENYNAIILPDKETSSFFYQRCKWLAKHEKIFKDLFFVFADSASSSGDEYTWRTRDDFVFMIWNLVWYLGIPIVYLLGLDFIFKPKKKEDHYWKFNSGFFLQFIFLIDIIVLIILKFYYEY